MFTEQAVAHWNERQDVRALIAFVETEVRKKDADLLEEMLDAMERLIHWDMVRGFPVPYRVRDPIHKAINAARARLENAP